MAGHRAIGTPSRSIPRVGPPSPSRIRGDARSNAVAQHAEPFEEEASHHSRFLRPPLQASAPAPLRVPHGPTFAVPAIAGEFLPHVRVWQAPVLVPRAQRAHAPKAMSGPLLGSCEPLRQVGVGFEIMFRATCPKAGPSPTPTRYVIRLLLLLLTLRGALADVIPALGADPAASGIASHTGGPGDGRCTPIDLGADIWSTQPTDDQHHEMSKASGSGV